MKPRVAPGRIVVATHNPGKLAEIAELLVPHGLQPISASALGLTEPDETAPDFAGNAKLKACAAAHASGLPSLADDSGFCVAALGGRPGVHSARWAGPSRDFAAAIGRVLAEIDPCRDRRAWFVCALALAQPGGETQTFLGRVDGHVARAPRGTRGFGYDPIFQPLGQFLTYGEMDPGLKNATSHRARASAQLLAWICRTPET